MAMRWEKMVSRMVWRLGAWGVFSPIYVWRRENVKQFKLKIW